MIQRLFRSVLTLLILVVCSIGANVYQYTVISKFDGISVKDGVLTVDKMKCKQLNVANGNDNVILLYSGPEGSTITLYNNGTLSGIVRDNASEQTRLLFDYNIVEGIKNLKEKKPEPKSRLMRPKTDKET